jgi:hypothetical protein
MGRVHHQAHLSAPRQEPASNRLLLGRADHRAGLVSYFMAWRRLRPAALWRIEQQPRRVVGQYRRERPALLERQGVLGGVPQPNQMSVAGVTIHDEVDLTPPHGFPERGQDPLVEVPQIVDPAWNHSRRGDRRMHEAVVPPGPATRHLGRGNRVLRSGWPSATASHTPSRTLLPSSR